MEEGSRSLQNKCVSFASFHLGCEPMCAAPDPDAQSLDSDITKRRTLTIARLPHFQGKDTGRVGKVRYSLCGSHNGALFEDDRCTNEGPSFPKRAKPRSFTLLCF